MDRTKINPKNDLTQGPILKKLIGFAIPVILGNLCMQLYNVVDSVIVGNYVGTDALAAVGAVFPIMMLFNALFMGVSMGSQIVISQTFGAKDMKGLRTVTNTAITMAIIIGAAITAIGTPLAKPLLRLISTPANIIANSTSYLMIIFAGTLGNVFYNLGSGVLRGMAHPAEALDPPPVLFPVLVDDELVPLIRPDLDGAEKQADDFAQVVEKPGQVGFQADHGVLLS